MPPVPTDIVKCFDELVPPPKRGTMTQEQTFTLIAALKRSEKAKSQCGKRLIAWYEDLKG
jgi:hypothetical protein